MNPSGKSENGSNNSEILISISDGGRRTASQIQPEIFEKFVLDLAAKIKPWH